MHYEPDPEKLLTSPDSHNHMLHMYFILSMKLSVIYAYATEIYIINFNADQWFQETHGEARKLTAS